MRRFKFARILLPLAVILTLVLTATPLPVSADTLYENYTINEDNATAIYGNNWLARGFSTGTAHTVSNISLLLYRTGSPGTVTVSVRLRDSNGHPVGSDLTAGTINGSTFTTDTNGTWYTIEMTPEYSLNGAYTIVVRAVAGDAGNSTSWRYDEEWHCGGGCHAYKSSTDGGSTWASEYRSLLYKVYGNPEVQIGNVSVFSSMVNTGDWLTVFLYKNIYTPYYQYEDPEEYFNLQFHNDTGLIAQCNMPAWGYKPGAIYLSKATVNSSELVWFGAYNITMEGSDSKFDAPLPSATHTLTPAEYIGSEKFWLGDWLITSAHTIEDYYGINLTMDTIGNETLPYTVLNEVGGRIYMTGIPGIESLCPERFYAIYWQPQYTNGTFTNAYQNTLNWVNQTSTVGSAGQIPTMLNTTGEIVNLGGNTIGMVIIFIVYIAVVGIALRIIGSVPWAVVIGTPVLVAGGWLGLIPLAVIMILAAMSLMAVLWIVYLRGT